jgi:hypothetical protein
MSERAAQLRHNLQHVQQQLGDACEAAGRDPASVTLIAVSKTWPSSDIEILHDLGIVDFGENRVDELHRKAAELASRELRWHFLGQIQSKKAAAVGRDAAVVHSVDRAQLLPGLGRGAQAAGGPVSVFVQVSLADMAGPDAALGRGGAQPSDVPELADAVAAQPWLRLAGVMTLPPRGVDPSAAFARIASVGSQLRQRHPEASMISAGMSHDFPAAVAAGATHVRIGSAVFGERRDVR